MDILFERVFNVICFSAIFVICALCAFSVTTPKDFIPVVIFIAFISFVGTANTIVSIYVTFIE